jgi:demethylmenaquinone methyltransferase/2-methoxy-6-polyprenyl-1,4-benzoquinol methylase
MQQQEIVKMFDEIAPTYDLVNKIVSFGIDKKWREEGIKEIFKFIKPNKVLDVACGTGDMIEIWQKYNLEICGIDPSKGMLEVAKKRFKDVKFYNSYATEIPVKDKCADVISISFGIRNVIDIKQAINEFHRVLKDGGIVLVLEFIKEDKKQILREVVNFYSNKILPKIGGLISNNKKAYEYLPNSIENFYTMEELIKLFEHKFNTLEAKKMNFGQVGMFIFKKK